MRTLPLTSRSQSGGFTLLEMIITLGIFILLTGAVFGIISGVLKSTAVVHDNQNLRDQVAALNAFIGKKLTDLPAQSVLSSYRRSDGEGLLQNGIVFGDNNRVMAIDAKIQPNGYYLLRFVLPTNNDYYSGGNAPTTIRKAISDDDPNLNWTPLIHDVKTLHWRFQDTQSERWADEWDNGTMKPNLVELTIQLAGDLQPVAMDFWLPPLAPPSLPVVQQILNPTAPKPQPAAPSGI